VAAYLVALRATAGGDAASFGYLRYATGTFRIALTAELEGRVAAIVRAIVAARGARRVARSHAIPERCAGCAVREHCDEALR
jgi:CRISPR/Cas system-associated exonuclease Cas4 (RecB family)